MSSSLINAASAGLNDGETTICTGTDFIKQQGGEQRIIRAAKIKVSGGSAMPLCGIVLPLSKRQIDYVTMLFSPPDLTMPVCTKRI